MFFPFYLFLDTTIQQQFQATFSLCCLMMCWCAGQCYQYDHISLRHKKTDRSYRSGPKQQITWSRSFKWIIEYSYFEYICANNKNHLKFDARSNNRKSKHRLTYKMFSLAYCKWIGIRYWWLTVRNVLHTLKRDCKRVDFAMNFVCSIRHTHMSMSCEMWCNRATFKWNGSNCDPFSLFTQFVCWKIQKRDDDISRHSRFESQES